MISFILLLTTFLQIFVIMKSISTPPEITQNQEHPAISEYNNGVYSIWSPTNEIDNLGQFISSSFSNAHCLLFLTGFRQIDLNLAGATHPVIVERFEIAIRNRNRVKEFMWMLKSSNMSN